MNRLKKAHCKKDKLIFGEVLAYCFHDNFAKFLVVFGDCFDFFFSIYFVFETPLLLHCDNNKFMQRNKYKLTHQ